MSHKIPTHCKLCFSQNKIFFTSLNLLYRNKFSNNIKVLNNSLIWTRFATSGIPQPIQHAIRPQVKTVSTVLHKTPAVDDTVVPQAKVQKVEPQWSPTPSVNLKNLPQYCMMLSKFRLTSLVVITTMAGYAIAPAPFSLVPFALCAIGTGLQSSAANAINQYHEVPFDAQMSRTKNRVLVKGLLTPLQAISLAAVAGTTGTALLWYGVNELTAALGVANLLLYSGVYTPMKRISIVNTWLGSIVGAVPPLMGWAGCTGSLDVGALLLAALLYSWQFPHFNALSWNLRPDYSRAGYRMMAVTHPALCRRVALRHTVAITGLCLAAPYVGLTNTWFALESIPLNLYFVYLAWNFYKKSDSNSSRKLFRFSLLHLPALMVLLLVNKKHWFIGQDNTEEQIASSGSQEPIRHPESKRITVLPRGLVVAAQDSSSENDPAQSRAGHVYEI